MARIGRWTLEFGDVALFIFALTVGIFMSFGLPISFLAANAFAWLYRISRLPRPRLFYRSYHLLLQRIVELQCSLVHTPEFTRYHSTVDDFLWSIFDSGMADRLMIATNGVRASFRSLGNFCGGVGERSIATTIFYSKRAVLVPALVLVVTMMGVMAPIVLVALTAYFLYSMTLGDSYRNDQRARMESNRCLYSPLKSKQIRVLHLRPGRPGSPLCCELESTPIDAAKYEALSYVWGSSILRRRISVNEKHVWIGSNLYEALTYLRQETKTTVLWVDAICINQADISERGSQVAQMRNIYSSATRAVVWLAVNPFGLRQILQNVQRPTPAFLYHYATVRVISQLLSSGWWVRVWVVQELVVARAVTIQCYKHAIEWDQFCDLVGSVILDPLFDPNGTHVGEFHPLREQRLSRLQSRPQLDLLQLLYAFRTKNSTDNRDKIFALLGLSNMDQLHVQDSALAIRADYESHPDDVFRDCAMKIINATRSLSIMALAECHEDRKSDEGNKPTWCPYWSSSGNQFRVSPFWPGQWTNGRDYQPWAESHFSAAGRLQAPPCEVVNGKVKLTGWVADEICVVGHKAEAWVFDLGTFLFNRPDEWKTLTPYLDLLVIRRNWEAVLPQWKKLVQTHCSSVTSSADSCVDKAFYATITAGLYDQDPGVNGADYDKFMKAAEAACHGRTFFITASGRFGLSPSHTLVGDKVYILLGSAVPMILRKLENFNTDNGIPVMANIGQAYVDELMYYSGDLQKDLDEGRQVAGHVYVV